MPPRASRMHDLGANNVAKIIGLLFQLNIIDDIPVFVKGESNVFKIS